MTELTIVFLIGCFVGANIASGVVLILALLDKSPCKKHEPTHHDNQQDEG